MGRLIYETDRVLVNAALAAQDDILRYRTRDAWSTSTDIGPPNIPYQEVVLRNLDVRVCNSSGVTKNGLVFYFVTFPYPPSAGGLYSIVGSAIQGFGLSARLPTEIRACYGFGWLTRKTSVVDGDVIHTRCAWEILT